MGNYPQYFDRVKYTLYTGQLGERIIPEPIGWQDDEKEYSRHEDYFGIFPKFSNSLKFVGESRDYIKLLYDLYGINAELKLTRSEKHPHTDEWYVTYYGYLDLSTMEDEKGRLGVKFSSGGIEKLLKNRESTDIEIDRLDTLGGVELEELKTIKIALEGREVFLHSKWKTNTYNNNVFMAIRSSDGNTRSTTAGLPIDLDIRSDELVHSVLNGSVGSEDYGTSGMIFFGPADRYRKVNVSFDKLNFKPICIEGYYGRVEFRWAFVQISIGKYFFENGQHELIERYPLLRAGYPGSTNEISFDSFFNRINTISNYNSVFELNANECLSLECIIKADFRDFITSDARFYVSLEDIEIEKFELKEESSFEPTFSKGILIHEALDRIYSIATDRKDAFYSDFFGRKEIGYESNGEGCYSTITHGFWVRGFDKLPIPQDGPPRVENLFKPLTTNAKDAFTSVSAVWGVGLGIETIGNFERIRIEDKRYFFNPMVTIKLPNQIANVKRSVATEYYYSKLEHGYERGGDYDEAYGLDEYNAKLNHQTPINRLERQYTSVSKYRADMYGMEFCRRKQRILGDTIDTSYDDSIWILDLKPTNDAYTFAQRKWRDDFEQAPTGVFSPETATNLRFSPFNMMLRNSWYFGAGFWANQADLLRYTSSTANSNMGTKLIGKPYYKENQDIICADLQRSYFKPEWVEFEHICDFGIMQLVNGFTEIEGKRTPNLYGLIEYINEIGETERGYLYNLKPNGAGKWKILKANR